MLSLGLVNSHFDALFALIHRPPQKYLAAPGNPDNPQCGLDMRMEKLSCDLLRLPTFGLETVYYQLPTRSHDLCAMLILHLTCSEVLQKYRGFGFRLVTFHVVEPELPDQMSIATPYQLSGHPHATSGCR